MANHSVFNELTEKFAPEIQKLKGLAIGALMGLAQDMIKHSVAPPLASELERVLDRVTTKLGGVPLSGSVGDLSTESASVTSQMATREVSNSKMAGVPDCSGNEKHASHY